MRCNSVVLCLGFVGGVTSTVGDGAQEPRNGRRWDTTFRLSSLVVFVAADQEVCRHKKSQVCAKSYPVQRLPMHSTSRRVATWCLKGDFRFRFGTRTA